MQNLENLQLQTLTVHDAQAIDGGVMPSIFEILDFCEGLYDGLTGA